MAALDRFMVSIIVICTIFLGVSANDKIFGEWLDGDRSLVDYSYSFDFDETETASFSSETETSLTLDELEAEMDGEYGTSYSVWWIVAPILIVVGVLAGLTVLYKIKKPSGPPEGGNSEPLVPQGGNSV
mmetsp:Transcript_1981/g.2609  ORF Transcript_1981/g.2609 Transcript_1981/m.2609 type:complete len:129 (-) Transcript_1981:427-813(-)